MKLTLLLSLLLLFLSPGTFAQNNEARSDLIRKINGEVLSGKILEESSESVRFVFKGERLAETIKKSDISRIIYANGRVKLFDQSQESLLDTTDYRADIDSVSAHAPTNRVAILPFVWENDSLKASDDLRRNIQKELHAQLSGNTASFRYQNIETTNLLLRKHHQTPDSLRKPDPARLCKMLGVAYIVYGSVSIHRDTLDSRAADSTAKVLTAMKDLNKKVITQEIAEEKLFEPASGGLAVNNYSVAVHMKINDETGNVIFSRKHNSYWVGPDAYKVTLDFLARKNPFYRK